MKEQCGNMTLHKSTSFSWLSLSAKLRELMCVLEPNRICCEYKIKQSFVSYKTSAALRCYANDISNVPLRKDCIKMKYSHSYEAASGIFSVSFLSVVASLSSVCGNSIYL